MALAAGLVAFYWTLLSIGALAGAAGICWFFVRRRVFPLSGREWSFVLLWAVRCWNFGPLWKLFQVEY